MCIIALMLVNVKQLLRSADQTREQRVCSVWARLELWVRLCRDKVLALRCFDKLDKLTIW